MKNAFKLSSLLFVGLILFQVSCSDDEPAPEPVDELVGKWAMTMATFISTTDAPADVLSIDNFPTVQGPMTVEFQENSDILALVVAAMADGVCSDPNNYATFFLELTEDGKLYLNCPAETKTEESGTWTRTEDASGTVITLLVKAGDSSVPISFVDYNMTSDKAMFSGRTNGFPMVKDYAEPIGGSNLQALTADMQFTRLP